jgi:PKD repeat protein
VEASISGSGGTAEASTSGTGGNATDASTSGSGGSAVDSGSGGTVNTPPIARLLVTPGIGDPSTVFTADAAGTTDREDPPSALTYAWDWESDGVFDATGSTATHSYGSAGTYTVVLRATDTGGLSGYRSFDVVVVLSKDLLVVTAAVDESNAGATPASPLGAGFSLREAITYANATAGRQSILIPQGMTIVLSGSLPLTADGAGVDIVGDRAVIDGGQKGSSFELASANDRLFGVEVHGCSTVGMRLSGAGVQVARTYFHDNGGAVETTGAACHFGPDNEIAFQNEGLTVSSQCLVERNRVHDCGSYGIHVVTNGSGSTFRFNASYRNAHGIGVAGLTNSITIVHNVMVFNTGAVSGGGGGIQLGGTSQDVRNNVLAFNGTYGMDARSASAPMEDYNDYFSNTKGACAGCTPGPHGVAVDPRFIDPATDDYRLLPGSPVINAAFDLGLDVNGAESGLFNGSAPDIGAWEAPSPY